MGEHYRGKGCQCFARSESECCCDDVDWRSARELELEAEVERLRKQEKYTTKKLEEALIEGARLREALGRIRNDGNSDQPPYHFWGLANDALKEAQ